MLVLNWIYHDIRIDTLPCGVSGQLLNHGRWMCGPWGSSCMAWPVVWKLSAWPSTLQAASTRHAPVLRHREFSTFFRSKMTCFLKPLMSKPKSSTQIEYPNRVLFFFRGSIFNRDHRMIIGCRRLLSFLSERGRLRCEVDSLSETRTMSGRNVSSVASNQCAQNLCAFQRAQCCKTGNFRGLNRHPQNCRLAGNRSFKMVYA